MKRFALAAVLGGVVAIGAVGCHHHKHEEEHDEKTVAIAVSELPVAVSGAFARDFPGMTIAEAKKETYSDGTVHYEIEYKDSAGKEHDVEYAADGEKLDKH